MVEYLSNLTSRESDLVATFGANGCITETTWEAAMVAELEGTTKLTSTDMRFLRDNIGKCTTSARKRTGFEINAGDQYAYIYKDDGTTYLGKTDTTVEIEPGLYILIVKKAGYDTMEVPMTVIDGQISSATITLTKTKTAEETEIESGANIGGTAQLAWTGKRKFPSEIKLGEQNWFGIEVTNSGTKTWVGYLGVRLTSELTSWTYSGDATKATTVKPGETKYIWCLPTVPETLGTGNINVNALIYKISG